MKKWLRRLGIVLAVAAVPVVVFAGYIGYRFYFYGPPAMHRAGEAASRPTVTLRYGASAEQVADLRMPAGTGPFPVAVIIHGGCWQKEETRLSTAALADALTQRGIATLNIEYRRLGSIGGGWPGTWQDIGAAIDLLPTVAPARRLDLSRVAVAGHSSGAHFAMWSAMRRQLDPSSPIRGRDPVKPALVVAIDGPSGLADFIGMDADVCGGPVISQLVGGTPAQTPTRYAQIEVPDHLPLSTRQLLVQGLWVDEVKPYIARARAAGDHVTVLHPDDARHFNILLPAEPQGAAVVDSIVRELAAARQDVK